jgi:glycosyltransferase involved in cell wall biosynthesis
MMTELGPFKATSRAYAFRGESVDPLAGTSGRSPGQAARKRMIMFAYRFPPCTCWPTSSGRAEGLARGLVECGWDPIVITRANGCQCLDRQDPDLSEPPRHLAEAPGVEVRRILISPSRLENSANVVDRWCSYRPLRPAGLLVRKFITLLILATDKKDDWERRSLTEGQRVLEEGSVDVIWTTSGPERSIGIGLRLQRAYQVRWVADLRDSVAKRRSKAGGLQGWARLRQRRHWFPALRQAFEVVGVSPEEAEIDERALGRPVVVLPSGFDFMQWELARSHPILGRPDQMQILYAGKLYQGKREPGPFFEGLEAFLAAEPEHRERVTVTYLGSQGSRFLDIAEAHSLRDLVVDLGFRPPDEARRRLAGADVLLLLTSNTGESGVPGGKFYDYLAAGPPILAVPGTDTFVNDLILRFAAGASPVTSDDLVDVLAQLMECWVGKGALPKRPLESVRDLSWPHVARRLSSIIEAAEADRASTPSGGP